MKKLGTDWRLKTATATASTTLRCEESWFDEVVVGDWLHVEMMDHDHAFAVLVGRRFDIFLEGRKVVVKEQEQ